MGWTWTDNPIVDTITGGSSNSPGSPLPSMPSPQDILDAISHLPSLDQIRNSIPAPPPVPQDVTDALAKIKSFLDKLPLPPPPPAPPPPIDPKVVLGAIAEALRDAEKTLNQQGLIIVNGTVNATMDVKIGSAIGGHAEINIQITPKPQS